MSSECSKSDLRRLLGPSYLAQSLSTYILDKDRKSPKEPNPIILINSYGNRPLKVLDLGRMHLPHLQIHK